MTSPHQQKLRVKGPVVVTANSLSDGGVVWWNGQRWSRDLRHAAVVSTSPEAVAILEAAESDPAAVGAYVAPVAVDDAGGIAPGNLREIIRAGGPTTPMPDHVGPRSATAMAATEI